MAELYDQDKAAAELCPFCEEPDRLCCSAFYHLSCTRTPGHDGPHVACGTHTHLMEFWQ